MPDPAPPCPPDPARGPRSGPPPPRSGQVALQQSAPWLAAMRRLGTEAEVAPLGPAGPALVLRARLPLVGGMALLTRADLALTAERAASLRRDLDVRHLVVNAETQADGAALAAAGFHRIAAARRIAELDLTPPLGSLAAGLDQKWRNRLRKGQAAGLALTRRPLPPDPRHWLFRAEAAQARRLWYRPVPAEVVAAVAAGTPGAAQLFVAHHLGRRVAAMLFLRHGRTATYQIGWIAPEGRALSAGQALMWRAMVDLRMMGTDRIDLGAADPALCPDLARFKRGTGATIRSLGGTWLDTAWAGRRGGAGLVGWRGRRAPGAA